jgi:adenine-specific DNA-methyltransferase
VTATIETLLGRISDPGLADQIRTALAQERSREFGLVFEHHLPETVELPGMPIRPGVKVRMVPRRGTTEQVDPRMWHVTGVTDGVAELVSADGEHAALRSVFDTVRVADFTDPIYPGLNPTEALPCGRPEHP